MAIASVSAASSTSSNWLMEAQVLHMSDGTQVDTITGLKITV